MREQLDLLQETDWDVLLVFDACRWDYWDEEYGVGEPVRSPASCTRDWLFSIKRELDWSDVISITGNPVVPYRGDFLKEVKDIGKDAHQKVNGVPTVPPEELVPFIVSESVLRSNRVYGHFVQPHGPYPLSDPPLYLHRVRPESEDLEVDVDGISGSMDVSPRSFINQTEGVSWETVQEGYRRNLRWVYDSVIDFAESVESKVVITSDHGEYLGEDGRYGHNCEYNSDIVRVVPWYEV